MLGSTLSMAISNGTNVSPVVIFAQTHSGRTILLGAAYKPCVVRGRNHYGNVRIGASVGSNTDKFLGGFHVGYEHNFALRKGWVLYVQAKCDLMVPDREDLFREGIVIGFKMPTLKH